MWIAIVTVKYAVTQLPTCIKTAVQDSDKWLDAADQQGAHLRLYMLILDRGLVIWDRTECCKFTFADTTVSDPMADHHTCSTGKEITSEQTSSKVA